MKKVLTGVTGVAMAATLLAGCGGGGAAGADTTKIRVAIGGDTARLDPAIVDDSITANILNQMYEGLYHLDADGNAVPVLAEGDAEVSDDGLTYTVKIKEGSTWSDGEAVTANDFVFAWKRAAAIGKSGAYYSQFVDDYIAGAIDGDVDPQAWEHMTDFGAVAVDDYTLEIHLSQKCPYFQSLLVNTVFLPVRESAVGEDVTDSAWADATDVPTNGAFTAVEINAKDQIVLNKNANYYLADEVVIEEISFKVMADAESETSAFTSGDIDFATAVNPTTVYSDQTLADQVYLIDPFVCNYYILINSGDENDESTEGLKAMKDPEIREAMAMAIDRDAVCQATGYGDAATALFGFIPAGIPGAAGDFREEAGQEAPSFDIEGAKAIMEKKGYSAENPLVIKYSYNDALMHSDVAVTVQASLKEAYIDFQPVASEKEAFFDARDAGEFELARHAMSADFMDPMAYLSMYVGGVAGNTVDDAKYDEMVNKANAMTDPVERAKALEAAEQYLVKEQHYLIPLFSYVDPILKAGNLAGVTSSPEGHYDLTRAHYE